RSIREFGLLSSGFFSTMTEIRNRAEVGGITGISAYWAGHQLSGPGLQREESDRTRHWSLGTSVLSILFPDPSGETRRGSGLAVPDELRASRYGHLGGSVPEPHSTSRAGDRCNSCRISRMASA